MPSASSCARRCRMPAAACRSSILTRRFPSRDRRSPSRRSTRRPRPRPNRSARPDAAAHTEKSYSGAAAVGAASLDRKRCAQVLSGSAPWARTWRAICIARACSSAVWNRSPRQGARAWPPSSRSPPPRPWSSSRRHAMRWCRASPRTRMCSRSRAALAAGLKPGALLLDCSTVSAETARGRRSCSPDGRSDFLDCPVSGGVEGARDATLAIMVGGAAGGLRARRSRSCRRSGAPSPTSAPTGSGQAAKATNQIMCAGIIEAVAEAMAFARAQGLPLEKLIDTLGKGAGSSWYFVHRAPNMARGATRRAFACACTPRTWRSATTWPRASAWRCRWWSACWASTPSSLRAATATKTSRPPSASRPSCSSAPTSWARHRPTMKTEPGARQRVLPAGPLHLAGDARHRADRRADGLRADARAPDAAVDFWTDLARTSLFLLWIGLAGAALLCALRARLARLGMAAGFAAASGAEQRGGGRGVGVRLPDRPHARGAGIRAAHCCSRPSRAASWCATSSSVW